MKHCRLRIATDRRPSGKKPFAQIGLLLSQPRVPLANLTVRDFSHSDQLTWDVADIYGVRYRDGGWYLKLTVDQEAPEVAIISFHPLQAPLRTNRGEIRP